MSARPLPAEVAAVLHPFALTRQVSVTEAFAAQLRAALAAEPELGPCLRVNGEPLADRGAPPAVGDLVELVPGYPLESLRWEGIMLTYTEQDFPGSEPYKRTIPGWRCRACGQQYGQSGGPPSGCVTCAWVARARPAWPVLAAALRDHWPTVECDHEAGTDRALCACRGYEPEPAESVGAAVEGWLQHLRLVVERALREPGDGRAFLTADADILVEAMYPLIDESAYGRDALLAIVRGALDARGLKLVRG